MALLDDQPFNFPIMVVRAFAGESVAFSWPGIKRGFLGGAWYRTRAGLQRPASLTGVSWVRDTLDTSSIAVLGVGHVGMGACVW